MSSLPDTAFATLMPSNMESKMAFSFLFEKVFGQSLDRALHIGLQVNAVKVFDENVMHRAMYPRTHRCRCLRKCPCKKAQRDTFFNDGGDIMKNADNDQSDMELGMIWTGCYFMGFEPTNIPSAYHLGGLDDRPVR